MIHTTRRITKHPITLCLPEDDAALPRDDTSLQGLGDDSRFMAFSPSLQYLSPFTGDIACTRTDLQQRNGHEIAMKIAEMITACKSQKAIDIILN